MKAAFKHKSLNITSSQAATQQDQPCSLVPALFSVGFFRQRFGNCCPTSTWRTGSGTHATGKHSFFLTACNIGWRGSGSHTSMTEHVTRSPSHALRLLSSQLCPRRFLLCAPLPLWSGPSQPLREESEEMQTRKKQKNVAYLRVSLLSISLSLTHSLSFCLVLRSSQWDVLTLFKRCACSIS